VEKKLGIPKGMVEHFVALCVAFEIVLMVVGVRPVLYGEDPYIGFSSYMVPEKNCVLLVIKRFT